MTRVPFRNFTLPLLTAFLAFTAIANALPAESFAAHTSHANGEKILQAATPSDSNAQSGLADSIEHEGPFSISGKQYTLLLNEKILRAANNSSSAAAPVAALADLQIVDEQSNVAYQETLPYSVADGHFSTALSASATTLSGTAGTALVIRFIEWSDASGHPSATESWQVFGVVNGQLVAFGPVLPLGQGENIATGGVVAGTMVPNGIAVVPLAGTAEALGFPVWTGNFYALVPVRIDWAQGKWGEGEQCYQLANGTLESKGCAMRVDGQRQPPPETGPLPVVRLFEATDGDTYHSQEVSIRPDSQVDFLQAIAIAHWRMNGNRVECTFEDVWLQTSIDGKQGWIHGEDSFKSLGLPHANPR